ncbi:MAG: 4Fe-4S dicluster domain-containing protein [Methylococcales bacterium]|nr:4Fe-4S dicluster domain-containing protein [Methylococcales bacterium]MDD5633275.1 4Fe-4S dicluster domain-containing protein [Methylococcales bacterium]
MVIVTENCGKCKYTDCVDVCPADAFREGKTMLVINPDECVRCTACIPECPVGAIFTVGELASDNAGKQRAEKWAAINRKFSALWPTITKIKKTEQSQSDSCKSTRKAQ